MSGPKRDPSKPNSRAYRDGKGGIVRLPASGCDLPVPDMPPGRDWTDYERELWGTIWSSPQATQFDDVYVPAVAAYIAHSTAIYAGKSSAWEAAEFRHLGDKLGLTPAGLMGLGWVIGDE